MSINTGLNLKTRFTQVLLKELGGILIHLRKIVGCLWKWCCHCTPQLLRKNFEYSCDQVTFRMAVSKQLP